MWHTTFVSTKGELERKIAASGFEILFSTSYAASLLPLMAVRRQLAGSLGRQEDLRTIARRELDVARVTNRLLSMILAAETSLTRRGVRWPAGGSRVVVARKIVR